MIKNKAALERVVPEGKMLLNLAEQALDFLQPSELMRGHLQLRGNKLIVGRKNYNLREFENIYVVGAGKATYQMTQTVYKLLKGQITSGFINVPKAYTKKIGKIQVQQAGHPYPTTAGERGARKILQLLQSAGSKDLVICLMSGGGSAMLPLPADGIALADKQKLTGKLLKCSADITEINTVRKHISQIKGGRLAQAAMPATLVALYISDVVGDHLDMIASGPTVPDPTSSKKALSILNKYSIHDKKLEEIIANNESPKTINTRKVQNLIVGNNQQVLDFLEITAKKNGNSVVNFTATQQGEASIVARQLIKTAQKLSAKKKKPFIFLAGGETTVTVYGKGKGGRNQELALSSLAILPDNVVLLSLATDGVDGVTPQSVAGAIVGKGLQNQCKEQDIPIDKFLKNNDSYNCLKQLGSLLITGPTGTNVGDIIMILINK